MKLAILSGANPQNFKRGAVIRLLPGVWRFHVHGLIDSELAMDVEGYACSNSIRDHQVIQFEEHTNIRPYFSVSGSEKSITVIAERINAYIAEYQRQSS